MEYFLDGEKISFEALTQERIKWEEESFGSYENDIVLNDISDGKLYFCRSQFYVE